MFAILPFISLIFLFLILYQREGSFRQSLLSSAILWGLLLAAITEFLSVGKSLTFAWLVGLWGFSNILLIYIYIRFTPKRKQLVPLELMRHLSPSSMLLLWGVTFIVATVGLTALIAPPNNWDSMAYHMARVAHWIQNQSVDHYPTHYLPQLYQSPWSEFAILHLQILSSGDYLANLVQGLSMAGSIVGVSLIAKELGADRRGQIFSAVVAATIPMGILQGSSTQNDYVASFWLVCLAYFVILTVKGRRNWLNLLQLSASLGLAILTKGTAYVYAFPLVMWFLISEFKYLKWRVWQPTLILGASVLFINFGHYCRNFLLFKYPLFTGEEKYTNDAFSTTIFMSNLIRNIALQLRTPSQSLNFFVQKVIIFLHKLLGVDINDPRTTWPGQEFNIEFPNLKEAISRLLHEDMAANIVHLLLIFCAILILILRGKLKKNQFLFVYGIALISIFLLFCFLLKWQPWHSRLHLPIFILFSAFIGAVFSKFTNRSLVSFLAIFLVFSSIPWAFYNTSRPLIGNLRNESIFQTSRIDQYFNNWQAFRKPYLEAAQYLNSHECSKIGLSLYPGAWEYPWWVLLQTKTSSQLQIENVNVTNVSSEKMKVAPYKKFIPCAIISLKPSQKQKRSKQMITATGTYILEFSSNPVRVFVRKN